PRPPNSCALLARIHLRLLFNDLALEHAAAAAAAMGIFDALYRVVMRRNAVYVTFVVAGAFAGERAVDYGVHKLWEMNNVGKRYEDISVLGQRPAEE
ncbi:unnamed protein product, partial [Urochloa humidicola]